MDTIINNKIYSNLIEYSINKEKLMKENEDIYKELKERKLLINLKDIIDYNDENIEYHKLQYIYGLKKEYTISKI